MALPQHFLDELLARTDIVELVSRYVPLKRKGGSMWGCCPFHHEKTPSFHVEQDKQFYKCFGCGEGGNAIQFLIKIENLPYIDAVRKLAEMAGMELPEEEDGGKSRLQRQRLLALNKDAARYFYDTLAGEKGREALQYLLNRGMTPQTIVRFGLGYAEDDWDSFLSAMRKKGYTDQELRDAGLVSEKNGRIYDRFRNRLMFPIIDVRGNVIGFGGRVLDDSKPKYLNSNETVIFNSAVLNFLIQTVFLTFLLLLCGEIFPKLVAKNRTLKWTKVTAPGLTFLFNFFAPVSKVLMKSSFFVNKVITKKTESISTDELSQALEISDVKEGKDKEMLEGILTFGETQVADIMISRLDVTSIEYHAKWSEVINTVVNSGFSRIPVYDTTHDSVKGVLYSKDLLPYIGKRDDSFNWQSLLRSAYYVPETRMIDDLMEDFRKKKIHIAIVIDEYGCTQGIVTLEDILEEIVGDIDDEYDDEDKLYQQLSPDTFVFDAKISLNDFCRITGTEEEEFGDIGEAETLAGLLLAIKGDFPAKKEPLVGGRCRFLVLDIQRHRIINVRVKVMPEIQTINKDSED